MAKRNGGIIGKVNTPTLSVASGVWANQDQFNARVGNIWPKVTYQVDFLVIAGGGGGGANAGTGAGAGGYRTSYGPSGGGAAAESKLTLTPGNVYTITVGAGGPNTGRTAGGYDSGVQGSNSSISGTGITTITSTGGGYGAAGGNAKENGGAGGSGGGAASYNGGTYTGGAGTANQGFKGGNATASGTVFVTGGGGGAGGAGTDISSSSTISSAAGPGLALSITGSSVTRAAGGRGYPNSSGTGTANTGNGGGAASAGGSGVVILRMPTANYSGTTTGSPTVTTDGSDTILQFNASGSYTA